MGYKIICEFMKDIDTKIDVINTVLYIGWRE